MRGGGVKHLCNTTLTFHILRDMYATFSEILLLGDAIYNKEIQWVIIKYLDILNGI